MPSIPRRAMRTLGSALTQVPAAAGIVVAVVGVNLSEQRRGRPAGAVAADGGFGLGDARVLEAHSGALEYRVRDDGWAGLIGDGYLILLGRLVAELTID